MINYLEGEDELNICDTPAEIQAHSIHRSMLAYMNNADKFIKFRRNSLFYLLT